MRSTTVKQSKLFMVVRYVHSLPDKLKGYRGKFVVHINQVQELNIQRTSISV